MAIHVSDLRLPAGTITTTRTKVDGPPAAPHPAWAVLRILLGSIFLWAFVDKLLALGFTTGRAPNGVVDRFGPAAWIKGNHPTEGFLTNGVSGPFADVHKSMAGHPVVDWLFMLCLLGVGLALVLGVACARPPLPGASSW